MNPGDRNPRPPQAPHAQAAPAQRAPGQRARSQPASAQPAPSQAAPDPAAHFRRQARQVAVAWAALIALLLASLGSAFLPLGAWNAVLGLAIATLKTAIVLWWFMHLSHASALLRLMAAAGLFTLALLFGLTQVDYRTRVTEPASMQPPQQLRDANHGAAR